MVLQSQSTIATLVVLLLIPLFVLSPHSIVKVSLCFEPVIYTYITPCYAHIVNVKVNVYSTIHKQTSHQHCSGLQLMFDLPNKQHVSAVPTPTTQPLHSRETASIHRAASISESKLAMDPVPGINHHTFQLVRKLQRKLDALTPCK
jgi:hypothetical protein